MSLIDQSYFVFDINLPVGTYSSLPGYINRFEPEILTELLGYELAALVMAYDPDTSEQRIIDFVEGKEYTAIVNGRDVKVKWNGLINTQKKSLIAYYVYYWYVRANNTLTTGIGEAKAKTENGTMVDASQKVMNAAMRLAELYGNEYESEAMPSAYNFLKHHEADYPEWIFTPRRSINSHDL